MKNILIIGAGLGGLCAGASLALRGHKITIIEKHSMVGGYATNFTRKKGKDSFIFDVSLHGMGDLKKDRAFHTLLEKIGLFKRVDFLPKKELASLLLEDGSLLDIPADFIEYKLLLARKFPDEEENINKLFTYLSSFSEEINKSLLDGSLPKKAFDLQKITLDDFLKKYSQNEELRDFIGFLWIYFGLPKKEVNAYFYLVALLSYLLGGCFYVKGGAGKLSKELANIIIENGGSVLLKEKVIKIKSEGKKIIEVQSDKAKSFKADYFIMNACTQELLNCCEQNDFIKKYKNNLSSKQTSLSFCVLYLGLDAKAASFDIKRSDIFVKYAKDSEEEYELIKKAAYEKMSFGITNFDLLDEDLNEKGCINLVMADFAQNWPEYKSQGYIEKKESIKKLMLEKLYKLYPKLKGHILVAELGTPHTMKRYTGNKNGAVYGYAQSIENAGFEREALKTPFDNAFLASAWTQPGGGYEGAMLAGLECAKLIANFSKIIIPKDAHYDEIKLFLSGLAYEFKEAKNIKEKANFKFFFTDTLKHFYLEVNGEQSKLVDFLNPDTTIACEEKLLQDISNGYIKGESAFKSGALKISGDIAKFELFPKLLSLKKPEKLRQKSQALIPLALVPFIIYWIFSPYYHGPIYLIFTLLYTLYILPFFTPKLFIGGIEKLALLSFGLYYLLFSFDNAYFIYAELILPLGLALSALFKIPIIGDYIPIAKSALFTHICSRLSLVFAATFTIQFIFINFLLPNSPFSALIYLINIIAIIYANKYPKSFES